MSSFWNKPFRFCECLRFLYRAVFTAAIFIWLNCAFFTSLSLFSHHKTLFSVQNCKRIDNGMMMQPISLNIYALNIKILYHRLHHHKQTNKRTHTNTHFQFFFQFISSRRFICIFLSLWLPCCLNLLLVRAASVAA